MIILGMVSNLYLEKFYPKQIYELNAPAPLVFNLQTIGKKTAKDNVNIFTL